VKRFVIGVLIIVLGAGIGVLILKNAQAGRAAELEGDNGEVAVTVQVAAARRGDLQQSLLLTGTIEAEAESDVTSKIVGKVTRVHVDEGASVRRGQLLVELERGDLSAQLRQAKAAVAAAEARLKQAEAGTGLQQAQTSTGIESAEAALSAARARLRQAETGAEVTQTQTTTSVEQAREALKAATAQFDMVVEGARSQQVEQANEAVRQAKASLDTARTNLRRAETLLAQGAIAQQEYDAAKLQFDVAQAQHNSAQQQLDLVREGARSQEVDMARAQVEQARSALVLAQANQAQNRISQQDIQAAREQVRSAEAALKLAKASAARDYISQEDVQAARAALNQARANVAYVETQIGYTYVRAPMPGVVTRRTVDPGEAASPGVPLLTITDNGSVSMRASLPETQLGSVASGTQVAVTVDALAGQESLGEVLEVIPAADPESRTFDIKIRVPNPAGSLKRGMFARATVVTATAADAVLAPRAAVVEQQGKPLVFVVEGGKAVARAVTTGMEDKLDVAIMSGLKEGDQIIVQGQNLVRDGQLVTARSAREADR